MSLLRSFRRGYASLASLQVNRKGIQASVAPPVHSSFSNANVQIATYDDKGPVSSLSLVVNLGSRHESSDSRGAAHFLKNVLVRNLPGDTLVRTVRETELRGNTLYSSVSREQLILGSEFLRDDLVDVVPLLLKLVFNPSIEPFEFLDAIPTILAESKAQLSSSPVKLWESAHSLAFRSGLGAPLFLSPSAASNLTRAKLTTLLRQQLTAENFAIVGTGIDHKELVDLVNSSIPEGVLSGSTVNPTATKYFGDAEARFDSGPSSSAKLLISWPTAGVSSSDYPAVVVLSSLLNGAPRTPFGNPTGILAASSTPSTSAQSQIKSYTDAGLLGVFISGNVREVKKVGQSSVDALQKIASGTVPAEQFAGAKKAAVVGLDGTREDLVSKVATEIFTSKNTSFGKDLKNKIEGVTVQDVIKVAKAAVSAKPSVVGEGDIALLPYGDEFKF